MAKIKTKARALDMLGRQQIAGVPTALSELFKNAHDAYADNVEVDYIRKKNLLILRDDGLGMTLEEFEQRWLTIGTSSKLIDDDSIKKPPIDTNKEFRHIMGEKGIGRLSIAAIGPQVLVLTRAIREDGLKPLVVAFVNWTMFTLPSLDLEDIEIPVEEIYEENNLTKEKILEMIKRCKDNVNSLSYKISKNNLLKIQKQLDSFNYDPAYWEDYLGGLTIKGEGHGTHFIITPTDEILEDDIAQSDHDSPLDQSSRLEKALLGFTNTMYNDSQPPIIARFRDHMEDGQYVDRISESIFFTPSEFNIADHHFEGEFNEFGQFIGRVSIYGEPPIEHIVTWPNSNLLTKCGPFKLKIAYIHGLQKDSRLPPELWTPLKNKTDRYGGLYIYRDGIRILPYGDVNSDFLKIEQRRSRSASEYFFSYRRLFGAIELRKENNAALQEKAGREGFIENKAFKQFKEILENFFIQTARDFFLERGDLSEIFIETKNRYNKNNEILKNHAKQTRAKKEKFKKELINFFNLIDDNYWDVKIEKLNEWKDYHFRNYIKDEQNLDKFYTEITNYCKININSLKKQLEITKPVGIGMTNEIGELWDRYQVEKPKLIALLENFKNDVDRRLIEIESDSSDFTNMKRRLEDSLNLQQERYNKELNEAYSNAKKALKAAQEWANEIIKDRKKEYKSNLNNIQFDFASSVLQNKSADDIYAIKKDIENRIEESSIGVIETIKKLTDQVLTIKNGTEENTVSSSQLTETLETELEILKEQQANDSELILLGMALSVVHHEFNGNIRAIRSALRDLKPWAEKNVKLDIIYQRIRASFDHLDGYLKTFTPLTRRLSRTKVSITGSAIIEFLRDVFDDRLEKENIQFVSTNDFLNQEIFTYTSTIYPVIINLIDNAIYWLSKTSGQRKIFLDATNTGFIIGDSGPGISSRDRDVIFKMGFTRKQGGRGMGLFIAKECLFRDDFSINLSEYQPNQGAFFIIEPINSLELDADMTEERTN